MFIAVVPFIPIALLLGVAFVPLVLGGKKKPSNDLPPNSEECWKEKPNRKWSFVSFKDLNFLWTKPSIGFSRAMMVDSLFYYHFALEYYLERLISFETSSPKNAQEKERQDNAPKFVNWLQFRFSPKGKSLDSLNSEFVTLFEKAKGMKPEIIFMGAVCFTTAKVDENLHLAGVDWPSDGSRLNETGGFYFVIHDVVSVGNKKYVIAENPYVIVSTPFPNIYSDKDYTDSKGYTVTGSSDFYMSDLSTCKEFVRFDLDYISTILVVGDSPKAKKYFEDLGLSTNPPVQLYPSK